MDRRNLTGKIRPREITTQYEAENILGINLDEFLPNDGYDRFMRILADDRAMSLRDLSSLS